MNSQHPAKSFSEIIGTNRLVLVDFFTEWCGPCKMMTPILEEVKASIGDRVKIFKIDAEKNLPVSVNFQVAGVPTLILFKDGQVVWRQSGVVPAAQLRAVIESKLHA